MKHENQVVLMSSAEKSPSAGVGRVSTATRPAQTAAALLPTAVEQRRDHIKQTEAFVRTHTSV